MFHMRLNPLPKNLHMTPNLTVLLKLRKNPLRRITPESKWISLEMTSDNTFKRWKVRKSLSNWRQTTKLFIWLRKTKVRLANSSRKMRLISPKTSCLIVDYRLDEANTLWGIWTSSLTRKRSETRFKNLKNKRKRKKRRDALNWESKRRWN